MDNIKNIVQQVILNIVGHKKTVDEKLEKNWYNLLEKHEQKHVKFVGQRNGIVSVFVDSPARLYVMQVKKNKLLQRLQEENPGITEIQFKIGNVQ
ncbi:MAG TPA: hypothetical protein DD723_10320 [Candidatus Omnitrophica bacterium]|nr:MAG: hypothetical protein A2Z81_06000 [Omnitrophica WOR_2 bacterium GWA2_45_18]HBR15911.1 hypothetical protein [Candidatus Omnitrophota bacterium]